MFGLATLTGIGAAQYSAALTDHRHTTMTFELLPTLSDALRILSETSGKTWTRTDFFKAVIDQALPLRATTPNGCGAVIEGMDRQHGAGLPALGYRRHALLSLAAMKNLAVNGETESKDVALESGDSDFMPWPAIKARRLVLKQALDKLPRPIADRDWDEYSTVFMGESDVVLLSQWVTVTDETCRVPAETMDELLALTPGPAPVSNGKAEIGVKHRMSQNLLDGPIKAAIDRACSLFYQDVWIHLREIAKDGTPPFTGVVEGNKLGFVDDNNKYKELSKDALRKRMQKYQRY